MCCQQATAGLSAPGTDPRRRYLIKMQREMEKESQEMIPPLRGGDFQGMAGLSSDDSLLARKPEPRLSGAARNQASAGSQATVLHFRSRKGYFS